MRLSDVLTRDIGKEISYQDLLKIAISDALEIDLQIKTAIERPEDEFSEELLKDAHQAKTKFFTELENHYITYSYYNLRGPEGAPGQPILCLEIFGSGGLTLAALDSYLKAKWFDNTFTNRQF